MSPEAKAALIAVLRKLSSEINDIRYPLIMSSPQYDRPVFAAADMEIRELESVLRLTDSSAIEGKSE